MVHIKTNLYTFESYEDVNRNIKENLRDQYEVIPYFSTLVRYKQIFIGAIVCIIAT